MKTRHFKLLGVLAVTILTLGVFQASAVQAEDGDVKHIWTGGAAEFDPHHADGFSVNRSGAPVADQLQFYGTVDGASTATIFADPEEVLILGRDNRIEPLSGQTGTVQGIFGSSGEVWHLPGDPTNGSPGLSFEGLSGWSASTMTLLDVQMPDEDATFAMTNAAMNQVRWQADDDGVDVDAFQVGASHVHYSWFFSHAGLYVLDVEFASEKPDSTPVTDTATYYACMVDDAGFYNDLPELLSKLRGETITPQEEDDLHDLIDALEEDCGGINLHEVLDDDHGHEPGGPGEGDVEILVAFDSENCVLTMDVGDDNTELLETGTDGSFIVFEGDLPDVLVTSCPTADWSVNGQLEGDFTSGANTIDGQFLGWAPQLIADNLAPGHVDMGGVVTPGQDGTGLKDSRTLAHSHGGGQGSAEFYSELTLSVPDTTQPGEYKAVLALTVFGN